MRRGIIIGFVVLGLTACGQGHKGSAEAPQAAKQAAPQAAPSTAPSAAASEAAKPAVSAAASQDATSCLDLVASSKYSDAVPVCTRALSLDSTNEKVKAALETANAEVAAAASGAADAAKGAVDDAAKQVPKSY
jgi:predicted small lipoprotein YifL